jgi:hypothetical protein
VELREGAGERLLNEIVRGDWIVRQNQGVPCQPRDQGFDFAAKLIISAPGLRLFNALNVRIHQMESLSNCRLSG